jgi:hypothetical protein
LLLTDFLHFEENDRIIVPEIIRGERMIQTNVKASQSEKKRADGTKVYELWLEVAINYNGAKNNWCVKLETDEDAPFDTTFVEHRFSSWLGLRFINGTTKGILFYVKPPYNSTANGDAFIREVSDWLTLQEK